MRGRACFVFGEWAPVCKRLIKFKKYYRNDCDLKNQTNTHTPAKDINMPSGA